MSQFLLTTLIVFVLLCIVAAYSSFGFWMEKKLRERFPHTTVYQTMGAVSYTLLGLAGLGSAAFWLARWTGQ